MLTAKEQNAARLSRIWKNTNGILNVETPYECICDVRFDCRCFTFMHALEEANNYDDVLAIEGKMIPIGAVWRAYSVASRFTVKTGEHPCEGRQWIRRGVTIRGVIRRGETMPILKGCRMMVGNGPPHTVPRSFFVFFLSCADNLSASPLQVLCHNLLFHAENNDYAIDVSGRGMEASHTPAPLSTPTLNSTVFSIPRLN